MEQLREKTNAAVELRQKSSEINITGTSLKDDIEKIANQSIASTEDVTEFLLSVMSKDCKDALGKCEKVLKHEPDNQLFAEFYRLLLEQLEDDEPDDSLSDCSSKTWSSMSSDENESRGIDHINTSSSSLSGSFSSESDT